ncbi:MAG: hypothetical protein PHC66_02940 [Candidatus Nanoarchaeia archaeon]|nr:hypothetical protein [Candidatus Nanoarchaeia archaeon]MDD5239016.1 hypothetical protein [Candidatus Nanoarchaeia archaeon]
MIADRIGNTAVSEDRTEIFTPVTYGVYQLVVKTKKTGDKSYRHTVRLAFIAQDNNERSGDSSINALEVVMTNPEVFLYEDIKTCDLAKAVRRHVALVADVSENADDYSSRIRKVFRTYYGEPWNL